MQVSRLIIQALTKLTIAYIKDSPPSIVASLFGLIIIVSGIHHYVKSECPRFYDPRRVFPLLAAFMVGVTVS